MKLTEVLHLHAKQPAATCGRLLCGIGERRLALLSSGNVLSQSSITEGEKTSWKRKRIIFPGSSASCSRLPGAQSASGISGASPISRRRTAAGVVVGALFFVTAIFATLTSCISVLESITANCVEIFRWERKKAVRILSVIYLAASAVIALGYSVFYFEVQLPNGSAAQLLDIMDYVSNSVMMPFIALLSTILIGWIKTPDYVIGEMGRNGEHFRRKSVYRVMIRYIAPVMMLILFLQSTGILS